MYLRLVLEALQQFFALLQENDDESLPLIESNDRQVDRFSGCSGLKSTEVTGTSAEKIGFPGNHILMKAGHLKPVYFIKIECPISGEE